MLSNVATIEQPLELVPPGGTAHGVNHEPWSFGEHSSSATRELAHSLFQDAPCHLSSGDALKVAQYAVSFLAQRSPAHPLLLVGPERIASKLGKAYLETHAQLAAAQQELRMMRN